MRNNIIFLMICLLSPFWSVSQNFGNASKEEFIKMAKYLSRGSGKWIAPNPGHDPEDMSSPHSIGLWFDHKLEDEMLHLAIVAYRSDTVHISSSALWTWHPGEHKIKYYDMNLQGIFMEGETYFTADSTFITRSFTYYPDGKIQFALGENVMVSEDLHRTKSDVYENGEWRNQASFTWRLTEKNEGYKVIKYH